MFGLRSALAGLRRTCGRLYLFLTSPLRCKPNLFILGFHKCGSTYLADMLRAHACVDGPNWLAKNGDKETYAYMPWRRNWMPVRAYYGLRLGCRARHIFDACPIYAYEAYSLARIQRSVPDAKVVLLVRDQVSRFESHVNYFWLDQQVRPRCLHCRTALPTPLPSLCLDVPPAPHAAYAFASTLRPTGVAVGRGGRGAVGPRQGGRLPRPAHVQGAGHGRGAPHRRPRPRQRGGAHRAGLGQRRLPSLRAPGQRRPRGRSSATPRPTPLPRAKGRAAGARVCQLAHGRVSVPRPA